jgi:hypothetical protein
MLEVGERLQLLHQQLLLLLPLHRTHCHSRPSPDLHIIRKLNAHLKKIYEERSEKNPRKKAGNSPYHHSSSDLHGGNISSEKILRVCKALGPASGFYTDKAPNDAPLTVELFAQVRSNGRTLDNIRHVLGGFNHDGGRIQNKTNK